MLLPTLKEQTVPRIVVVSACRTPQGRFLGGLASSSAAQLGAIAAEAALARASIAPDAIDQVIVGNVLGAGLGQNVARQVAMGARVPVGCPAFSRRRPRRATHANGDVVQSDFVFRLIR